VTQKPGSNSAHNNALQSTAVYFTHSLTYLMPALSASPRLTSRRSGTCAVPVSTSPSLPLPRPARPAPAAAEVDEVSAMLRRRFVDAARRSKEKSDDRSRNLWRAPVDDDDDVDGGPDLLLPPPLPPPPRPSSLPAVETTHTELPRRPLNHVAIGASSCTTWQNGQRLASILQRMV